MTPPASDSLFYSLHQVKQGHTVAGTVHSSIHPLLFFFFFFVILSCKSTIADPPTQQRRPQWSNSLSAKQFILFPPSAAYLFFGEVLKCPRHSFYLDLVLKNIFSQTGYHQGYAAMQIVVVLSLQVFDIWLWDFFCPETPSFSLELLSQCRLSVRVSPIVPGVYHPDKWLSTAALNSTIWSSLILTSSMTIDFYH